MFLKYYSCFVASLVVVTNGEISSNEPFPDIPDDILNYFDQRFGSLTSGLSKRIEEFESRHNEDVLRIEMLEQFYANSDDQLKIIRREMGNLRAANNDLQKIVNDLQNQLYQQTVTTESETDAVKLTNNINNITSSPQQSHVGNFSSRSTGTGNKETTVGATFFKRKAQYSRMNNLDRDTRVASIGSGHAFYAILSQKLVDPGNNRAIAFQNIVTLVGGAYSSNTGAFTCQKAGLYVFHWNVRVLNADGWMYTHIVRNGNVVGTANGFHGSTGSAAAVLQLSSGDEVWISVSSHSGGVDVEQSSSMFSGFLIN
ncbi:uncharacterized protein [Argopecten irradians]|uniref:uncharacterized protein n=1 Tax=Argopecten irradians TaxID=31199 RepID=UPI00371CB846